MNNLIRWLVGVGLSAAISALAVAAEKPNIVYILADDLGWKDAGFRGGNAKTPHLDHLAAGGATLSQLYVQPYSTQTRAALLTGRYPMRYGLQTQSILPTSQYGLPPEERTLAQALKEAGYKTAFIGKWQLGHAKPEFTPLKRGFDYFYGSLSGDIPYTLKKGAKADWYRGTQALKEEGYVTALLAKDAAAQIANHSTDAPLFLMLAFAAPQGEAQAPKAYLDRYANEKDDAKRNYLGAVSALDDGVGQIIAALEKKKMLERTLIIFHSDNGGALPTRFLTGDGDVKQAAADNDIFRDGKGSLHEGGVRGYAVLHWPGVVAEKSLFADLLHVTDLYPTLLKLGGANLEQTKKLDGMDIWPVITERALSPRKEVLINIDDFRGALRVGEWKLVVHSALPSHIELFDLGKDPEEAANAADRYPEHVQELMARLNTYAYDMAPAKFLEELSKPHSTEIPTYWGYNSSRK